VATADYCAPQYTPKEMALQPIWIFGTPKLEDIAASCKFFMAAGGEKDRKGFPDPQRPDLSSSRDHNKRQQCRSTCLMPIAMANDTVHELGTV
jgi:hypothetical protein